LGHRNHHELEHRFGFSEHEPDAVPDWRREWLGLFPVGLSMTPERRSPDRRVSKFSQRADLEIGAPKTFVSFVPLCGYLIPE
jgi:hypothetical protein